MELRSGYYAIIEGNVVRMYHSYKGWELISNNLEFTKYGFISEHNYYVKLIDKSSNISAYHVNVFCRYKGGKCQVLGVTNSMFFLNPSIEYQSIFRDYAKHGYDPQLEVNEKELKEIWEERKPIEGFNFDVVPIVYIKKNGVWLGK